MKKYFTVTFEIVGSVDGSKTDKIMIWAKTVSEAVRGFTETTFDTFGFPIQYTEYAIVSVDA